jgi:hypothetical protein
VWRQGRGGRWIHECVGDALGSRRDVKRQIPEASVLAREGREARGVGEGRGPGDELAGEELNCS